MSKPVLISPEIGYEMLITLTIRFSYRSLVCCQLPLNFIVSTATLDEFLNENEGDGKAENSTYYGVIFRLFLLYFDLAGFTRGFQNFQQHFLAQKSDSGSIHIERPDLLTWQQRQKSLRRGSCNNEESSSASQMQMQEELLNLFMALSFLVVHQSIFCKRANGVALALRYYESKKAEQQQ